LQGIDVVKKNTAHFIHLRRDIARHRGIDDEQRPLQSFADHRSQNFRREQRFLRRRGRNQNVDLTAFVRPMLERNSATLHTCRKAFRPLE